MTARLLAGLALPPDASADGHRIDALFVTVGWMLAAVALVALAWLALMLIRDRGGAPRHDHGTSRRGRLVPIAITTVVFVVVDGTLLVGSLRDVDQVFGRVDDAEREPGAVRLEITGRQWSWDVRYPGPDGRFATGDDVVALDRLVLPRGRAVVIELASVDVVHGFFLLAFRVKLDAVPGRIGKAWFRPAVVGRYELGCAQFCGVSHDQMRGVVEVLEPAAFDAWLAREATDAARIQAEDERAIDDEPSRLPDPLWPRFSPIDPATARGQGWPWGAR